jgi:hypothetical protein
MQLCIVPKHRLVYPLAEKEIMANVSKVIFGAAIVAASPSIGSVCSPKRSVNFCSSQKTSQNI